MADAETLHQPFITTPLRAVLAVVGTATLIYLSTWSGPGFFWLYFQRTVEAAEEGALAWVEPTTSAADATAAPWGAHEAEDTRLPLPPGQLLGVIREEQAFIVRHEAGTLHYRRFDTGFVSTLLAAETERLGGDVPTTLPADADALAEIARETPRGFDFGLSGVERSAYAARLLCKLLLWENVPVERFELARDEASDRACVLVAYPDASAKVVLATPRGTLVVTYPPGFPTALHGSAGSWLQETLFPAASAGPSGAATGPGDARDDGEADAPSRG